MYICTCNDGSLNCNHKHLVSNVLQTESVLYILCSDAKKIRAGVIEVSFTKRQLKCCKCIIAYLYQCSCYYNRNIHLSHIDKRRRNYRQEQNN